MRVVSRSAIALAVAGLVAAPAAMAHDQAQQYGWQEQGQQGGQTEGYGRSHAHHSQHNVRQVQQKLKDMGYDPGPIDGKVGPQTRAGLKQFQEAQNLPASGRLDSHTMAALKSGGSATSGAHGTQPGRQANPPGMPGHQGMDEGGGTQGYRGGSGTPSPD